MCMIMKFVLFDCPMARGKEREGLHEEVVDWKERLNSEPNRWNRERKNDRRNKWGTRISRISRIQETERNTGSGNIIRLIHLLCSSYYISIAIAFTSWPKLDNGSLVRSLLSLLYTCMFDFRQVSGGTRIKTTVLSCAEPFTNNNNKSLKVWLFSLSLCLFFLRPYWWMPCKRRIWVVGDTFLSSSRLEISHPYTPTKAIYDLGWLNRYLCPWWGLSGCHS